MKYLKEGNNKLSPHERMESLNSQPIKMLSFGIYLIFCFEPYLAKTQPMVCILDQGLQTNFNFKIHHFQGKLARVMPENYNTSNQTLQNIFPSPHFKQVFKRRFTQQSWNKKHGKPLKPGKYLEKLVKDHSENMMKSLYLTDNYFHISLF